MRDFVILGSSIITPPPNSHPPPSSSSSTPHHRHPIFKPHKSSLPNLRPLSSHNTSSTPLQAPPKLKDSDTLDTDSELNPETLANAVLVGIKGKNVRSVIESLNKAEGLGGVDLSAHLDASIIADECCQLVTRGHIEEAVELMEILPRNFLVWLFFLFKLVDCI